MFAVPGWKISAPLKTQTAPVEVKSIPDNTDSSKKRKRNRDDTSEIKNAVLQEGKGGVKGSSHTKEIHQNGVGKTMSSNDEQNADVGADKKTKSSQSQDNALSKVQQRLEPTDEKVESASSKRRKRRKKQKDSQKDDDANAPIQDEAEDLDHEATEAPQAIKAKAPIAPPTPAKLTPLQSAMRQKLISSRFRYLNETLYTTPSASSAELFKQNPSFFTEYHEGFARQVEGWPENPVDGFVNLVLSRGSISDKGYVPGKIKGEDKSKVTSAASTTPKSMGGKEPLPRDFKSRVSTIADLGCGSGSFAVELQPFLAPLHLKVHSFDLAAPNEHVTVADIRSLPLPDNSVDVAVFSLALMGTNWIEFIEEAWRVLRWKGECWVADVNSRFAGMPKAKNGRVEHSVGARVKGKKDKGSKNAPQKTDDDDEAEAMIDQEGAQRSSGTDVAAFVDVLRRRGFALVGEPDLGNKMFARMRFTKSLPPTHGKCKAKERNRSQMPGKPKFLDKKNPDEDVNVEDEKRVLKPCVYKQR